MSTRTSTVFARVFGRVLCLSPMLAAIGCGAGFDSPDWVKSLRVLGVQKDYPYAPPTNDPANPSEVKLTMLDYDGTQKFTDTPRTIERLWFSGCDDLPGDQYFTCLAYMNILWQKWKIIHPKQPPEAIIPEGTSWSPGDPGVFPDEDVVKMVSDIAKIVSGVTPQITSDQARAFLVNFRIGRGERFTYQVPLGIIANHRTISDPNLPAYGLSFIFFTLCAGHIDVAPNWKGLDISATLHDATLGFPFICADEKGNAMGPDDFVSGYTQLFVYGDGTANYNPLISGVSFVGPDVTRASADADAGADAGVVPAVEASVDPEAYCIDGACVPLVAPKDPVADPCKGKSNLPRVHACTGKCPTYSFSPTMDKADMRNNDIDVFVSKEKLTNVGEQMWVDYYTDRGTLKHTVKLLRDGSAAWSEDGSAGWSADFSNQWTAPANPGPVNLWAVAHDTRGGTGWVRLQVCVDK